MKKILMALFILVLMSVSVFAVYNKDATRYSIRKNVGMSEITSLYGVDLTGEAMAYGHLNTYANLQRGDQTQGYVYVQYVDAAGDRGRVSINWKHTGNRYGVTLMSDTASLTRFSAQARVIINREITYGTPVIITYYKDLDKFWITGYNLAMYI